MIQTAWSRLPIRLLVCIAALAASRRAEAQVEVEAYAGRPFGVGRIVVTTPPGRDSSIVPLFDDRFSLVERDGRAHYPAIALAPVRRFLRRVLEIKRPQRVEVLFLFRGSEPLNLTFYTPAARRVSVRPVYHARQYERTLSAWWRQFTGGVARLGREGDYPMLVENYLTATLGSRLGLSTPRSRRILQDGGELDEALGMILGAESVRLAMQKDLVLGTPANDGPANLPLPAPIQIPALQFAEVDPAAPIEPLAGHVPEECLYVRFGNFSNYLWLKKFLDQWGGNLQNMIAVRGFNYLENDRLQTQIALRESKLAALLGPAVIADVAFVANDTFMREGAALGVLFQARNSLALSSDFLSQRRAAIAREKTRGVVDETVKIAGRDVSFLHTPDNRVRSFYAVDGEFHLVTTSRRMVERFFEAGEGKGSLGESPEFRAARSRMPVSRNDTVFAYLSDAFFRQLTSPHYRVEMTRRMHAKGEIEILQVARLAAAAERVKAHSIDELVAAGFLPRGFGIRADGSRLVEQDGRFLDSLRGARGTFLPVSDVEIHGITASEQAAYQQFAAAYRAEWERMPPVMAAIRRDAIGNDGLEQITLDLEMTPYAQKSYQQVADFLGEPSIKAIAPVEGDMISLQLTTSGRGIFGIGADSVGNHMFLGIRDYTMPIAVSGGAVVPNGRRPEWIRGYLGAWPRPGLLGVLVGRPDNPQEVGRLAPLLQDPFEHAERDDFMVLSFKRAVLDAVVPQLQVINAPRPAQVRLRVADFTGSQLAGAINAFGYMRAQQTSLSGARFMNSLSEYLQVPREAALDVAEQLLDARLECALSGKYALAHYPSGHAAWTSSALLEENRFGLTRLPEDYEFPLLKWFRGIGAELTLANRTLTAHAEIYIQQSPPAASSGGFSFPSLPGLSFPKRKKPSAEELPAPKPDGKPAGN